MSETLIDVQDSGPDSTAGNDATGKAGAGDGVAGANRGNDREAARANRTGQGRSGENRSGENRAGESRTGQGRAFSMGGRDYEVPDDLWDAENGRIRAEAAVKRALDLRRQISARNRAPESYEAPVPAALQEKIGDIAADDPLLAGAKDWARKNNLSQEAFGELATLYFETQAAALPDADAAMAEEAASLDAALGPDAEREKTRLGQWVTGALGNRLPDYTDTLTSLTSTANGVLLLKSLHDAVKEAPVPDGRAAARPLSQIDIDHMMASPAYSNPSHPEFTATQERVQAAFRNLYPEG